MRSSTGPLAVVDTNVFVSAYMWGGNPGKVINLWQKGDFDLCISPELLRELIEVLVRFNFESKNVIRIKKELEEYSVVIIPRKKVSLCRDPKDNKFLELALAASADYLITGDKDLLILKKFEQTLIVTPKQFLDKIRR